MKSQKIQFVNFPVVPRKKPYLPVVNSIQDEELIISQGYPDLKRIYDQTRSEGCLFFSTSEYTISKICQVPMKKKRFINSSVPMYVFWFRPSFQTFTKLMMVPISLLRKLNKRLIIYLDKIIIFGQTWEETLTARDTLIFLLQNLGFPQLTNLSREI